MVQFVVKVPPVPKEWVRVAYHQSNVCFYNKTQHKENHLAKQVKEIMGGSSLWWSIILPTKVSWDISLLQVSTPKLSFSRKQSNIKSAQKWSLISNSIWCWKPCKVCHGCTKWHSLWWQPSHCDSHCPERLDAWFEQTTINSHESLGPGDAVLNVR